MKIKLNHALIHSINRLIDYLNLNQCSKHSIILNSLNLKLNFASAPAAHIAWHTQVTSLFYYQLDLPINFFLGQLICLNNNF